MPRAIWTGTISFGLVTLPVKLYSAVSEKTVRFHQLHAPDNGRIQQRRFCALEEREVPYNEIVKGYEIAPDRYVVIEPEELAALEPSASKTIDIEDFVGIEEIDPIYFDRPYTLVPGDGAAKPYSLLLQAMRETGKVAIARIVLRSKERLVAIRPRGEALLMTTMSFADEIQDADSLPEIAALREEVDGRELDIARRLIDSISEPFDIGKYHDAYREAILEMIDRKAAGEQVPVEAAVQPRQTRAPDLMSALQASLDQVRERSGSAKKPAKPRRRSPAGSGAAGDGAAGGPSSAKKASAAKRGAPRGATSRKSS